MAALAALTVALLGAPGPARAAAPVCSPGHPVTYTGEVASGQARSYLVRPFTVAAGTTRVEATYDWADKQPALPNNPITQTVFDLGVWDQHGYRSVDGFRGWSGSRAGRVSTGQPPVFIQQDVAQRGYRPGPIQPGQWWLELGIAAVAPSGATWTMTATCTSPAVGAPFVSHPVDPTYVARNHAGWYEGDFHMHGVESNLHAPTWQQMVAYARSVGLDFMPVTDYVTNQQWRELGPVQAANPDMLLWPSREIITYFGHMIALGETPHVIDYRQGFENITAREIQRLTKADGALFQVAHPTTFPGPLFRNFCRGCEFELGDVIDWNAVDSMEVQTGPILVSSGQLGLPDVPAQIQNPFTQPAIDLWVSRLMAGNRITAVSGSDSKGVEDANEKWGTTATAVYADNLSRDALKRAVRAGHAYVRTKGALHSPELSFTAGTAMMGDVVPGNSATMTVTVKGAANQVLTVFRNRDVASIVPITSDPFTYSWTAARASDDGPLGTIWRVETADLQSLTTISNPIFLGGPPRTVPTTPAAKANVSAHDVLPVTGGGGFPYVALMAAIAALAAARVAVVRSRPSFIKPGSFWGRGST